MAEVDIRISEITKFSKKHFLSISKTLNCSNSTCNTKFNIFQKGRNCYRCGKIFCNSCLCGRCNLSLLAEPDPSGRVYEVCRPCSYVPQCIGKVRCHKSEFISFRRLSKHRNAATSITTPPIVGQIDSVNFDNECERLTCGFKRSVKNSEIILMGLDILTSFKTLQWQKSNFKYSKRLTRSCHLCRVYLGSSRKSNCVVCGLVLCSSCSHNQLLIYISDEGDDVAPRLAIINIVGCPDVEPRKSMLLVACTRCRGRVEEKQVKEYYNKNDDDDNESNDDEVSVEQWWEGLVNISRNMRNRRIKVNTQVEQYGRLTHQLESGQKCQAGRSHIHVLAKAQLDLSDHFAALSNNVLLLKKLQCQTPAQKVLIHNMTLANAIFYQDNKYIYNEVKKVVEYITPPDVLISIQACIDEKAISSAFLSTRQLGLEVLHLTMKYDLSDVVALELAKAEQTAENDLKVMLSSTSEEDWESYISRCNTFLSTIQLKEHRFIRLKREQPTLKVGKVMLSRSKRVLEQIIIQFEERCSEKRYKSTKAALRGACDNLESLQPDNLCLHTAQPP